MYDFEMRDVRTATGVKHVVERCRVSRGDLLRGLHDMRRPHQVLLPRWRSIVKETFRCVPILSAGVRPAAGQRPRVRVIEKWMVPLGFEAGGPFPVTHVA